MSVYKAIAAITGELSKEGVAKGRKNQQQGYSFRGIDDMYNALSPLLAKHGLCVLPRIMSREITERVNKSGNALFYVVVEAEFDFVAAEDGSRHVVRTFGEAMDSADKATNKAMSAAYKYAVMQAFAIPTEGDNDADATTHEVVPKPRTVAEQPKPVAEPEPEPKKASSAEQKRGLVGIAADLLDCHSEVAVKTCADGWQFIAKRDGWSRDFMLLAKEKFDARRAELRETDTVDDIINAFPGSTVISDREVLQHPMGA